MVGQVLEFAAAKKNEATAQHRSVAADGETGLRRATDESFDLLILDVMLPRIGGF